MTEKCFICDGKGWYMEDREEGNEAIDCIYCNGKGEVETAVDEQEQADANLSKILNPENKHHRIAKEIGRRLQ